VHLNSGSTVIESETVGWPVAHRTQAEKYWLRIFQMSSCPSSVRSAHFLQAILEGIADIEHLAYNTLENLGAPAVTSIRTVGGGASNAVWNDIRQQTLGAPFLDSLSSEAAVGTASLARDYIC